MEREWPGLEPQPPHTIRLLAVKKGGKAPVGGKLLGIEMPNIYAIAKGRTWFSTKAAWWYPIQTKGGFPQKRTLWFWAWRFRGGRAFDAGLIPVLKFPEILPDFD